MEKLFEIKKNENSDFILNFNKVEYDEAGNISSKNHAWFLLKPKKMGNKTLKYKLNEGDIIKIGRITIRITEIKNDKNNNDSYLNQKKNGNNLSNNSINIINSNNNSRIINEIIEITNAKKKIKKFEINENINSLKTGFTKPVATTTKNSYKQIIKEGKINLENKCKINIINENNEKESKAEKDNNQSNDNYESQSENGHFKRKESKNKICRICYMEEDEPEVNPLLNPCICAGSMKYIHFICLRQWINNKFYSKIENNKNSYCSVYKIKPVECELCKTKFPDLIIKNEIKYDISELKPEFDNYMIFESLTLDKNKNKYIYILSLNEDVENDNKIYVGRDQESHVLFSDISISRIHCLFNLEKNKIYINDNDSTFGTLVLIQSDSINLTEDLPLFIQIGRTFFKIKPKKNEKNNFLCCKAAEKPNDKFYFNQNERHIFYRKKITMLNLDENKETNNDNLENNEEVKKENHNKNNENERSINIKKLKIKKTKSTNKEEEETNKGDERSNLNKNKKNSIRDYLANYNENTEKVNSIKDISVNCKSLREIKLNDELVASKKDKSIEINKKNIIIFNKDKDEKKKQKDLIDNKINDNSKNNSQSIYVDEEN